MASDDRNNQGRRTGKEHDHKPEQRTTGGNRDDGRRSDRDKQGNGKVMEHLRRKKLPK